MNIAELTKNGATVQVVVNLLDLKELFMQWHEETKQSLPSQPKEDELIPLSVVVERYGVDPSTLWRWDKTDYLKKVKVGGKVFYKKKDLTKLMEG